MIIAALVDLGVPPPVVEGAILATGLAGFHLHFGHRTKSGIVGAAFDVHPDGAQPPRTYGEIRRMLEASALEDGVKARAQATFLRLAKAEARVHRTAIDDVHFHEVGAVDAIADILLAVAQSEREATQILHSAEIEFRNQLESEQIISEG